MRCVVFELAGGHICAPPPPAMRRWLRPPAVRGLNWVASSENVENLT